MHILLVNDDGPPSTTASPYILSLVRCLQNAGHTVSVILPHIQRSWIGKAHFIGQLITPTYYRPPAPSASIDSGTTHEFPLPKTANAEEWVLVDGTPATCTQIGLNHFFRDRGPVDLVLSGPNYGRNTTSLFALSSGTLGGALEAVAFKKHAIALSYAFFSREIDQNVLDVTSKHSVKVIEYLAKNWGADVEVYSVNVPLVAGVDTHKVLFTDMLENYWSEGSAFDEVEIESNNANEGQQAEENERKTREDTSKEDNNESKSTDLQHARHKHRHFKWAPKFADVHRSVEQSKPGNDGWAIRQGYTSITPLRASFTAAKAHRYGEVNLDIQDHPVSESTLASHNPLTTLSLYIHVAYEDLYVQPYIIEAIKTIFIPGTYLLVDTPPGPVYLSRLTRYLQISPYESLPHETLLNQPMDHFGNSYTIRKALIRKHYLSHTVASWVAKYPGESLKEHVPLTLDFELDYAEFLDDALVEAWEVKQAWEQNLEKAPEELEWWILKPSMSDKGQGIRLFSSQEQLQEIFDQWETENPNDSEEEDNDSQSSAQPQDNPNPEHNDEGLMISQLRHFIIQPYVPALLIPSLGNRKFHIRSYVLAIGALKVYVYSDSLALHSAHPYTPPTPSTANLNLESHLTNTALQTSTTTQLVYPLSALPSTSTKSGHIWTPTSAQQQIHSLTASLFRAAAAQPTSFQPLPNCFEVFGIDWLVDQDGKIWLLEVNAFPDFRQTGADLGERIVGGFWKGVINVVAKEWFSNCLPTDHTTEDKQRTQEGWGDHAGQGMWEVLDLDMGRH